MASDADVRRRNAWAMLVHAHVPIGKAPADLSPLITAAIQQADRDRAGALREAAERIVAATFERLSQYEGEHAETARDAISSCVNHLTNSAARIEVDQ